MGVDFDRESPDQEDALLATLLQIHRSKQERANRAGASGSYARILKHFAERGQRLRGERLVTAELIERLFESGKGIPARHAQQELEIIGAPGATAAGRLRVTNRSAARARFDFVVGEPLDGGRAAPIAFDPQQDELDPGQTQLVRVEASLTAWRDRDRVTIPIECRWASGRDRLWLIVSASPAPGSPR